MPTDPVTGRRKGRRGVYREVYDHYAQLIDEGQLKPGDRIPSSSVLAEEWDISHATAAKALQLLRDTKHVRTTSKGTFVHHGKVDRLLTQLADVLNALEDEGQGLHLDSGTHGICIRGSDGGVRWNGLTVRWETADC